MKQWKRCLASKYEMPTKAVNGNIHIEILLYYDILLNYMHMTSKLLLMKGMLEFPPPPPKKNFTAKAFLRP